jgi:hypothetical protein
VVPSGAPLHAAAAAGACGSRMTRTSGGVPCLDSPRGLMPGLPCRMGPPGYHVYGGGDALGNMAMEGCVVRGSGMRAHCARVGVCMHAWQGYHLLAAAGFGQDVATCRLAGQAGAWVDDWFVTTRL